MGSVLLWPSNFRTNHFYHLTLERVPLYLLRPIWLLNWTELSNVRNSWLHFKCTFVISQQNNFKPTQFDHFFLHSSKPTLFFLYWPRLKMKKEVIVVVGLRLFCCNITKIPLNEASAWLYFVQFNNEIGRSGQSDTCSKVGWAKCYSFQSWMVKVVHFKV